MDAPLKIVSWNVNGLRALARKQAWEPFLAGGHHIVGLQEVRATAAQLGELAAPTGWPFSHVVEATRPGYSGVALFSRLHADACETALGKRLDRKSVV